MADDTDEVAALRDVARRAAVLARWFSRDNAPFVDLTEQHHQVMDPDAEALTTALYRAGYYPEGWGS